MDLYEELGIKLRNNEMAGWNGIIKLDKFYYKMS